MFQVWILLFLVTVPCLSIRVTTPRGQLEGQYEPVPDYNEDIAVFRGIRYADPPARFKKSKIVTPWDGKFLECRRLLEYSEREKPQNAQTSDIYYCGR